MSNELNVKLASKRDEQEHGATRENHQKTDFADKLADVNAWIGHSFIASSRRVRNHFQFNGYYDLSFGRSIGALEKNCSNALSQW